MRGVTDRKAPLFADTLAHARGMRRRATDAELKLWRHLRCRLLAGEKFRRQYPVGPFIVDFFCADAKLAIELDGGGHGYDGQAAYDAQRQQELQGLGIRVLRFWNNDVLQKPEEVLESIREALVNPSPLPSPEGRGRKP